MGAGAISQLVHLPLLRGRDDVEIRALSDVDPDKAESIAARFEIPEVREDAAILEDPGLDAVLICTPNYLHESHATAALRQGKFVFVERPLATSADGARRVLAAAQESGCGIMMNTAHRMRPDAIALYSFVAGGELGDVQAVRGSFQNRRMATTRAATWRHRTQEAGGGALLDLGVPILDLCLWLIGYPAMRRVSAVTVQGEHEVEDAAVVLAETVTGVALAVDVSWTLFGDEDRYAAQVLGRRGTGSIPPLSVFRQIGGRPMSVTPPTIDAADPARESAYLASHRRILDRFVGAVKGERPADLPTEQIRLLEVIEAAYASARSGRDVVLHAPG